MSQRVSIAAWAAGEGITRQAAYKLVRSGAVIPGPDGLVDPAAASQQRRNRLDPSRIGGRGATMSPGADLHRDAKTAGAMLDVRIKEFELKRLMGEVVDRAEERRAGYEEARRARDQLEALANRLAPVLAGMTDAGEIYRLLRQEHRAVLQELSGTKEVERHDREGEAGGGGERRDDAHAARPAARRRAGGGGDADAQELRAPAREPRRSRRGAGAEGGAEGGPGPADRAGVAAAGAAAGAVTR